MREMNGWHWSALLKVVLSEAQMLGRNPASVISMIQ
jgi:hypothetical protein